MQHNWLILVFDKKMTFTSTKHDTRSDEGAQKSDLFQYLYYKVCVCVSPCNLKMNQLNNN